MVPGSKSIIPPVVFLCRYLCMVISVQLMKMLLKRISSCPSHWWAAGQLAVQTIIGAAQKQKKGDKSTDTTLCVSLFCPAYITCVFTDKYGWAVLFFPILLIHIDWGTLHILISKQQQNSDSNFYHFNLPYLLDYHLYKLCSTFDMSHINGRAEQFALVFCIPIPRSLKFGTVAKSKKCSTSKILSQNISTKTRYVWHFKFCDKQFKCLKMNFMQDNQIVHSIANIIVLISQLISTVLGARFFVSIAHKFVPAWKISTNIAMIGSATFFATLLGGWTLDKACKAS